MRLIFNSIQLAAAWLMVCLGGSTLALAKSECSEEWICIRAVEDNDTVYLVGENLRNFPVTLTMRVETRNMARDKSRVITETLAATETRRLMRLSRISPDRDFHYSYRFDWTIGDHEAEHDQSYVYTLPYAPGKSYYVLQGYGSSFSHTGLEQYAVDFNMPEGTTVHAARDGVVARVMEANSIGCWEDGCGRHANYIVVQHADGTTGEYYHLKYQGALVEPGDKVAAGQPIGLSGNTGHTTMPHLHFAVYRATEWGNTQSIAVRFRSRDGIISNPRAGGRYLAQ